MPFGFGRGNEFDNRGTGGEGKRHDEQTLIAKIVSKLPQDAQRKYLSGELSNADIISQYGHLAEEKN